ncbi:MAG: monovalent cation/H(+) antiporter subunit G [Anaerolineae bacterium]
MLLDIVIVILILAASFFFLAGTVGLLRLPDMFTRLHALTKADNLGLLLISIAAALKADSWEVIVKLAMIWVLVIIASSTVAHLIGRVSLQNGQTPWEKPS